MVLLLGVGEPYPGVMFMSSRPVSSSKGDCNGPFNNKLNSASKNSRILIVNQKDCNDYRISNFINTRELIKIESNGYKTPIMGKQIINQHDIG